MNYVGDLHRAGAHLILAYSPERYVYRAQEALRLYQGLYAEADTEPTEKRKRSQEMFVAAAKGVLERAIADALEYESEEPIDEEAMQKQMGVDLKQAWEEVEGNIDMLDLAKDEEVEEENEAAKLPVAVAAGAGGGEVGMDVDAAEEEEAQTTEAQPSLPIPPRSGLSD